MKNALTMLVAGLLILCFQPVSADTLALKDGTVLEGYFQGGNARVLKFEVDGVILEHAIETIASLTFGPLSTSQPSTSGGAGSVPPASTGMVGNITLPIGHRILVRTTEEVTSKKDVGHRFAGFLEVDITYNGRVVAPRGAAVYGRVVERRKANRLMGKAKLVIALTEIEVNGKAYGLTTHTLGWTGSHQGTIKRVGGGAAIGGVVDGWDGAGKGAAIGGVLSLVEKSKQVEIPAGAIIDFRLSQPLTI
jgi:hypothetical protein